MTDILPGLAHAYPSVKPARAPRLNPWGAVNILGVVAALGGTGLVAAHTDTPSVAERADKCFTQHGTLTEPFDGEFASGTSPTPDTATELTRCLAQNSRISQEDENIWAWRNSDGGREGVAVTVVADTFVMTFGSLDAGN